MFHIFRINSTSFNRKKQCSGSREKMCKSFSIYIFSMIITKLLLVTMMSSVQLTVMVIGEIILFAVQVVEKALKKEDFILMWMQVGEVNLVHIITHK